MTKAQISVSIPLMKKALITGITGQDGSYLAELLLQKGYEVHGLVNGQRNSREAEFRNLFPNANLHRGDLTDFTSLLGVISSIHPDEIYNLGAISFVGMSFQQPELTANVTGLGALRILEAVRKAEKRMECTYLREYFLIMKENFADTSSSPGK